MSNPKNLGELMSFLGMQVMVSCGRCYEIVGEYYSTTSSDEPYICVPCLRKILVNSLLEQRRPQKTYGHKDPKIIRVMNESVRRIAEYNNTLLGIHIKFFRCEKIRGMIESGEI